MTRNKKKARYSPWFWFCVFLVAILLFFWGTGVRGFVEYNLARYVFLPAIEFFTLHPEYSPSGLPGQALYLLYDWSWSPTKDPFLNFIIGIFHVLAYPVWWFATLIFYLCAIVISIPFSLLPGLLKASPTLKILAFFVLCYYGGHLFYGVVFPLLYKLLKPVLVHTIGEFLYQKNQAIFYGEEKARFKQPLYLTLSLIIFSIFILRLAAPFWSYALSTEASKKAVQERIIKISKLQLEERKRLQFGIPYHQKYIKFPKGSKHPVYKFPDHKSEILYYVKGGETPEQSIKKYGNWYLIYYRQRNGWVYRR